MMEKAKTITREEAGKEHGKNSGGDDMTADQCENITTALYQIHGIASFVIGVGNSIDAVTGKGISDPVASIAQAIQEKAEYCLAILNEKEAAA